MSTLVTFLHVVVSLILVGTVLLQQGKGGGMGGAFGGANAATVFGSGGASTFLRRLTAISATIFMLTSILLAYIASNDAGDALRSYSSQQAALKKRKKDAEKRALEGEATEGAGSGEGSGAAPPTGADVDDGDTGEDETDGETPTGDGTGAGAGSAAAPAAPSPDDGATEGSGAADVPAVVEEPPAPAAGSGTGSATP
jgi:preprotein translocase subunit SecG